MNRNPTTPSAFSKVLFEGLIPIKVLLLYRPLSLPFIADHKFSILVQTPGDAIIISDSKEDGWAFKGSLYSLLEKLIEKREMRDRNDTSANKICDYRSREGIHE